MSEQIVIVPAVAGEDLSSQNKSGLWVYADAGESYKIKQISDITQRAFGVLLNNPRGDNQIASVAVEGGPATVQLGGTVNPGALVTYDATGKTIAATAGRQAIGVYLLNGDGQVAQGASGQDGQILIFGPKINQFFSYGILRGSLTHNFPSISSVSLATQTLTVTGAQVGDTVVVGRPATLDAGLVVSGEVTSANTVTVTVNNPTAGAIDPPSLTYPVTVFPAT